MKLTTKEIIKLNPFILHYNNSIRYSANKTYTVEQFLDLSDISHEDKLSVVLRLVSRDIREVFGLDCAMSAISASVSAYNEGNYNKGLQAYELAYSAIMWTTTVDSCAYAIHEAASAASKANESFRTENQRQIEALIYLIQEENKNEIR